MSLHECNLVLFCFVLFCFAGVGGGSTFSIFSLLNETETIIDLPCCVLIFLTLPKSLGPALCIRLGAYTRPMIFPTEAKAGLWQPEGSHT